MKIQFAFDDPGEPDDGRYSGSVRLAIFLAVAAFCIAVWMVVAAYWAGEL